jgi:hypothetical protein
MENTSESQNDEDVEKEILELLKSNEVGNDEAGTENLEKENSGIIWWHSDFKEIASKLPASVLAEMEQRILSTKIGGNKLDLQDNSVKMANFFEKELQRYNRKLKRQEEILAKKQELIEKETQLKKMEDQASVKVKQLQHDLQLKEKMIKFLQIEKQQTTIQMQNLSRSHETGKQFVLFCGKYPEGMKMINLFRTQ